MSAGCGDGSERTAAGTSHAGGLCSVCSETLILLRKDAGRARPTCNERVGSGKLGSWLNTSCLRAGD
jgi:hypothetical protein